MIPLPTTFRHGGFAFRLLTRAADVALFEKRLPGVNRASFEVVIVQRRPEATFPGGRVTPAHEAMLASEQWGSAGWSFSDRASAEARFNGLVASRQDAPPAPQTPPCETSAGVAYPVPLPATPRTGGLQGRSPSPAGVRPGVGRSRCRPRRQQNTSERIRHANAHN